MGGDSHDLDGVVQVAGVRDDDNEIGVSLVDGGESSADTAGIEPATPIVLMSFPVASVEPQRVAHGARRNVGDRAVGAVAVMSRDHLDGVVSERDIVRALSVGEDPANACAGDVMAALSPSSSILTSRSSWSRSACSMKACVMSPSSAMGMSVASVSVRAPLRAPGGTCGVAVDERGTAEGSLTCTANRISSTRPPCADSPRGAAYRSSPPCISTSTALIAPAGFDDERAFERLADNVRHLVHAREDSEVFRSVEGDLEAMRGWLARGIDRTTTRGLAASRCHVQGWFEVIDLPVSVRDEVGIGPAPLIRQLAEAYDEPEAFLLALVDRTHLRLFRGLGS